jgi:hypothetical protein
MSWQIQLALLLIVGGAQVFLRSFSLRVSRVIYWIAVGFSFLWVAHVSYLQYLTWKMTSLGQLLLPPHESILYFIQYVGWRFFSPAFVVFLFSFLFIFVAKSMNKKGGERFFEKDEIYIAALAIVNAGYPQILVFFVSFAFIFLIINIISTIIQGSDSRISPYYLWIPAAVIAIMISELWLSHMPWWNQLII